MLHCGPNSGRAAPLLFLALAMVGIGPTVARSSPESDTHAFIDSWLEDQVWTNSFLNSIGV
eukprot:SAG31_NODE_724_length_12555_cov_11.624277_14_plen_61_part_00